MGEPHGMEPAGGPEPGRRMAMCRLLLRLQQAMETLCVPGKLPGLTRALAPNSYHAILIELYLAELDGRLIYQSSLAPGGPPANAHRQIARLEALSLVSRTLDTRDHRRVNVALTAEMRLAIDAFMVAVDGALRATLR